MIAVHGRIRDVNVSSTVGITSIACLWQPGDWSTHGEGRVMFVALRARDSGGAGALSSVRLRGARFHG
jgi:hypothetical protein